MDSSLQHMLKSLCLNMEWKYAVFWKLKHRARVVLTWEDAYYDNRDQNNPPEHKCASETPKTLDGGHFSHDPLGLAVAKLSYRVFSLGEGIVGQVAVSGKHRWIFAEHVNNSGSSYELYDEWQSHFSAGIQTILVLAVGPCGVIQLGSLNKVHEDVRLLTRIRDLFLAVNYSPVGNFANLVQCSMMTSACLPDLPPKGLGIESSSDCLSNVDKAVNTNGSNFGLRASHCTINQRDVGVLDVKHQNQGGMDFVNDALYDGDSSCSRGLTGGSDHNFHPDSGNSVLNIATSYGSCFYIDSAASAALKVDNLDPYPNEIFRLSESSDFKYLKDLEEKFKCQTESGHFNATNTSGSFYAGSELLEALGPAFQKGNRSVGREAEKTEAETTIELTEALSTGQLTFDSDQENLLEAVIANVCHGGSDVKHEMRSSKSLQSLLITDKMVEPSSDRKHFTNPVSCSVNQPSLIDRNASQNSSEICGAFSSIGFSSTCPSACSEQFERCMEIPKKNKKRAKPGESSRPRPRDRQLIQDRIKELRELIPNGSKCSIDSLLERTIKHLLFLQSVTKHADQLSKCAESKVHCKEANMLGSSNSEHGSSWAMEIGGHLKVCSIVVENLNKQGLLLIEMLCEECNHFLEIAEAIRSLGLVILKGVTEAHGEKTCICFVVEGQNNKPMHRMDILWSLVQIFQPKATGKAVAAC